MKAKMSWLDKAFEFSLALKGLNGLAESVSGVLLVLIPSETIIAFTQQLTLRELTEDPNDFISQFILKLGQEIGAARTFGAIYLLTHGLVKVVIVYYLLRGKREVYPWAIGILSAFTLYQTYLLLHHASIQLFALTVFDAIVVWLVIQEYRKALKHEPIPSLTFEMKND